MPVGNPMLGEVWRLSPNPRISDEPDLPHVSRNGRTHALIASTYRDRVLVRVFTDISTPYEMVFSRPQFLLSFEFYAYGTTMGEVAEQPQIGTITTWEINGNWEEELSPVLNRRNQWEHLLEDED